MSRDEALRWLLTQASLAGMDDGPESVAVLDRVAAAMAAVSAADVPGDVEPLPLSLPVPIRD